MEESKVLILSLLEVLKELEKLLTSLSKKDYILENSSSSIGAHVRHCIEHVEEFLKGCQTGRINYDKRKRDKALETSSSLALEKVQTLKKKLKNLQKSNSFKKKDLVLDFILHEKEQFRYLSCPSNLSRELLFLFQHTLHHLALLDLMLKERKIDIFLLSQAPSTLAYRRPIFLAK